MPLTKIEQISDSRYLAIWHMEESAEELREKLHPRSSDTDLLRSYRSDKKILEWYCGRLCLKSLCEHIGIRYEGLRKNTTGKPFLRHSEAEISLSHSYPYVAAILDLNKDVGIDLEQPKQKLQKVAHKFLNTQELHFTNDDITLLCIHWCAKETLYKIVDQKISFKNHMAIEPFEVQPKGELIGRVIVNGTINSFKLEYRIENDYILTFNL
ncbi:Siderophore (Surfactin) biosynthesis regulatory protein [Fulvivirga imtechensis AK7]|uniref:Siderophore (Surfactin) biosynthesis regulatory protein n=1 Tax=Fulvivirga imtechensis AK7 TaxID=1237149 RepID=L8JI74_9BACT|nr:4'-phosphopantetheinyl transferase family protein [Fulvivirga imtechensis]ELR68576.1 Siderophore (Surfactin) biosynthesis regulatory protein [Fulvivirga imtechensis AK7]